MRLYIFRGLDAERVPWNVTHAIVDESVTIIKEGAFYACRRHLVSIIMGDNGTSRHSTSFVMTHPSQLGGSMTTSMELATHLNFNPTRFMT